MNSETISVVVADAHEVVRLGLRSFFSGTTIKIVADAKNGDDALKQVLKHKPDVLLLDVPGNCTESLNALKAIRQRAKQTRVVVLSICDNPAYVVQAHNLGAVDYLLKDCAKDEVIRAVRQAAMGAGPIHSGKLYHVTSSICSAAGQEYKDVPLTPRELQILKQIAHGQPNKKIAVRLGICVGTVKDHIQNLLRKLGLGSRTQAAVLAVRRGLVERDFQRGSNSAGDL